MSELEDGNENENLTIGANQTRGRGTNGNGSDSFAIDNKGYGRYIESRIPAIDKQTLTECNYTSYPAHALTSQDGSGKMKWRDALTLSAWRHSGVSKGYNEEDEWTGRREQEKEPYCIAHQPNSPNCLVLCGCVVAWLRPYVASNAPFRKQLQATEDLAFDCDQFVIFAFLEAPLCLSDCIKNVCGFFIRSDKHTLSYCCVPSIQNMATFSSTFNGYPTNALFDCQSPISTASPSFGRQIVLRMALPLWSSRQWVFFLSCKPSP